MFYHEIFPDPVLNLAERSEEQVPRCWLFRWSSTMCIKNLHMPRSGKHGGCNRTKRGCRSCANVANNSRRNALQLCVLVTSIYRAPSHLPYADSEVVE